MGNYIDTFISKQALISILKILLLSQPCFSFDFSANGLYYFCFLRTSNMLESTLEKIAEKILALDEASLASMWSKYKERMDRFDTSSEWEKAVIVFFIINAVRAKNQIFNERILRMQNDREPKKPTKPDIKRIK